MNISIRLRQESELSEADYIFRLTFGIFSGLADSMMFGGDANYHIQHRWKTYPTAAFSFTNARNI